MTRSSVLVAIILVGVSCIAAPSVGEPQTAAGEDEWLPLTAFSPTLLGMYRKVMEIDGEIKTFTDQYELDLDLARAVVIHESGGNGRVVSIDGANGYFQIMPATFRSLRVDTNIEGGIKYLSQQVKRFGREDYALAAYNTGPSRVTRRRPMYLETLQYVVQISDYRNVLKLYDTSVRHHALDIRLEPVQEGDDWWSISRRLGISILQLRLHNPFLATRALRVGQLVAYPPSPRDDLFAVDGDQLRTDQRLSQRPEAVRHLGATPRARHPARTGAGGRRLVVDLKASRHLDPAAPPAQSISRDPGAPRGSARGVPAVPA